MEVFGRDRVLVELWHHGDPLDSARNDALANVAIIGAGLATALHPSIWPDVVVGLGIAWLNLDAAREVWERARAEGRAARAEGPEA